jgi:hypothetical protein
LEGRLVHEAIEESARTTLSSAPFDARRFMKRRLKEIISGEVRGNPRTSAGRLEASFSLDRCLKQYFSLVRERPASVRASPGALTQGPVAAAPTPPRNAAEFWVEIEDPPFGGRLDRVEDGVITDYKTGDPDPVLHPEQLRQYATLWWLRYGVRVEGLRLRYAAEDSPVDVPSESDLATRAEALRNEIVAINSAIETPPPPASPSVDNCRYCPVRQICPDYWVSTATQPLRGPPADADGENGQPSIQDIRLNVLPAHWQPGRTLTGQAEADNFGAVEVSLPGRLTPSQDDHRPDAARVLLATLIKTNAGWTIRPTVATEVFWEPGS